MELFMNHCSTPFDTIESAHDFVRVLAETIEETRREIQVDLEWELSQTQTSRRTDGLRMAVYNLEKLENHMVKSRRILNDLRSLRRLLFAEREFHRVRSLGTQTQTSPAVSATPAIIAAIPAPALVGATRAVSNSGAARTAA
jgi:hypothetical protein